ncbi:MAG: Asp-tRNA(Asn)/Glu-tRNA(Gln) amidotransferase GatCAB subunit B [Acidiferrobacteraceae bacterium]|nr:Asp-tRNA(Asn)/Glu-tRNA(Gln) amidotransferase GatCAB subunit B [Acidiferrobacteraceae bacterium]|tara:strand:- start:18028 stop:19461 length:1434 start_codon:yes stop_codon:yes gene_type:complete
MIWETVIGLEIHVQLLTNSKIFSSASTNFGAEPNSQANEVDVALPGVLPVMNKKAAMMAVRFGLAIGAEINKHSIFARKNYFYPDLPKGYQISQYELPIVSGGMINMTINKNPKTVRITRAHLEEDAGKLLHKEAEGTSYVDLNRAGTPLLEVVSEPDLRSPEEAVAYLKKIHKLVTYLEICDGNMEEGSFRCDANISVRLSGKTKLGTRCELKNLNSFRFVEQGLNFEIKRQIDILENGGQVKQETRLFDSELGVTRTMRGKEDAHDYRYFPDPDLPPLVISDNILASIKSELPELPDVRFERLINEYNISESEAELLTSKKELADFFEKTVDYCKDSRNTVNWIITELLAYTNREEIEFKDNPISPQMLGQLIIKINDNTISGKIAKEVFQTMWNEGGDPEKIISEKNLKQITDFGELELIIDEVLSEHSIQVEQYRNGQEKVLGFLIGKVMKATKGKANPPTVNTILKTKLREN